MTHLSIGGGRRLTLFQRLAAEAGDLLRLWRGARISARVARELRDCDDRLLRDMGLTRGDYNSIVSLNSGTQRKSCP